MNQEFRQCTALVLEARSGKHLSGTVIDARDSVCRMALREKSCVSTGSQGTVVLRTKTGLAVASCHVLTAEPEFVDLALTSRPANYLTRNESRTRVASVTGRMGTGARTSIKVIDLSEGGLSFECACECELHTPIALRLEFDRQILDAQVIVLRQACDKRGVWTAGAKWAPESRVQAARLRHLVNARRNMAGCLTVALPLEGSDPIAGYLVELSDVGCVIALRPNQKFQLHEAYRLVLRTVSGQSSVVVQLTAASGDKVEAVFLGQFDHYLARSSHRRRVNRVFAGCIHDGEAYRLRILDVSETGFRYLSDKPLPTLTPIELLFSFNGVRVGSLCQIVRQECLTPDSYTGGAQFCVESRIEAARLKSRISEAA